jgi:hypothetical protein
VFKLPTVHHLFFESLSKVILQVIFYELLLYDVLDFFMNIEIFLHGTIAFSLIGMLQPKGNQMNFTLQYNMYYNERVSGLMR